MDPELFEISEELATIYGMPRRLCAFSVRKKGAIFEYQRGTDKKNLGKLMRIS